MLTNVMHAALRYFDARNYGGRGKSMEEETGGGENKWMLYWSMG